MAKAKKVPAPTERQDLAALPMPTVDPQTALGAAKTVAKRLADRATRTRLDALPADALDPKHADAFAALITAAEAASAAYTSAESSENDARVPLPLVDAASKLRTRVFSLVEYHLGNDGEIARELAAIRAGTGHADLASDLLALALLVESNESDLKGDRRKYQPTDVAEARRLATEIQTARVSGQRATTRKAGRAWAVAFHALRETHDELVAAGRFLDRKRPDVTERWPSLFVALGTRKKGAKTPEAPVAAVPPTTAQAGT